MLVLELLPELATVTLTAQGTVVSIPTETGSDVALVVAVDGRDLRATAIGMALAMIDVASTAKLAAIEAKKP